MRARHAHAWTRAWVGDRWVDVDTTPPVWFAEEARLALAWQKVADLFGWASYRWAQRKGFEVGAAWLVSLGVLVVVFGCRIVRGKPARRARSERAAHAARSYPGMDSEFYAVERVVESRGVPRGPAEPLTVWASRTMAGMDAARRARLERALALHLRYRFDPVALDTSDRRALREAATSHARSLKAGGPSGGAPT